MIDYASRREESERGGNLMKYRLAAVLLIVVMWASGARAEPHNGAAGDARSGADALAGNPLEFDLATVKRGKQLYGVHCVRCHGVDGRGDTEMREFLKTAPADLTDGQWTYGDSDAVVFNLIKAGLPARDMPAFSDVLTDERIWQVISYIEYLGGRRP